MKKIATHDSATGEKGKWWCFPFTLFAKTQSKTLCEQYDAECRMFDIRIRKYNNSWHAAHGLWISEENITTLLDLLYIYSNRDKLYITITYEGKNPNKEELLNFYHMLIDAFPEFQFCYLAIKYGDESDGCKVKYSYLERGSIPPNKQGFKLLDGRSWHTYLPIPWLWKKIYYNNPEFDEKTFLYVDFL